ncbi:MBL fold metallo-hydrolase [Bacillus massiliigorillae]|uniref:MBL fold metallo-hydrolase n=1 Tax=Bacillus massiliigorillae TaxID=1243664 RepID=UPI0003A8116F|nr:MBL fold metallo-hydrolase [Bacillus massiliigorillae]
MTLVEQINSTIYCIDCHDLQREKRTGCYIMKGNKVTIIETSASPSIPYILKGLEEMNIALHDIDHIIVTHIHLDHAGGAGLLLEKCPNADIIVHPKGARHLEDPSRLIAGARAVYGDDFDELFNPIVPIPKDRIKIAQHGDQLILENRTLTFYDSPGHANHHIAIHDSLTNGIFTGDTAGIQYRELDNSSTQLFLPSTSPSQFNPIAMEQSIALFESLNPDYIYFGHYGHSNNPTEVFKQLRQWLPIFIECGKIAMDEVTDSEERMKLASDLLMNRFRKHLSAYHIPDNHPVYEILELDAKVSSMGVIDSLQKGVIQ